MVNSSPLRDDDRLGSGLRIRPELGICHLRRTADALAVVFDNDVRGRSFRGLTVVLVFSPVGEFPSGAPASCKAPRTLARLPGSSNSRPPESSAHRAAPSVSNFDGPPVTGRVIQTVTLGCPIVHFLRRDWSLNPLRGLRDSKCSSPVPPART